ncbi:MAG: aminotransferase class V-fold PLP-dependent enzyme [Myxococcota bacterium]
MGAREEIDRLAKGLLPHYSRFLDQRRQEVLMTGHSHQAWPDVSRDAHLECWDDAARLADHKWGRIFGEIIPALRARIARRLGSDRPQDLAFAQSTHELGVRLASCFPERSTVVTTDLEFHSLRRQLGRQEEDGAKVHWVKAGGPGFAEAFSAALEQHRPAFAALSLVFFTHAEIVTELPSVLARAAALEIPVLVDAYHAFNVIEIEAQAWPGEVFLVGGGYKYAEAGEGACFMLLPKTAARFRPRYTGWFADFAGLESSQKTIGYAAGGDAFFGSTFDPAGLYRMLRVLEWMDEVGLSTAVLRAQSLRQTAELIAHYDQRNLEKTGLGLATPRDERRAGFVAFTHPRAQAMAQALRAEGVMADARREFLRLGPAPYTRAKDLDRAMEALAKVSSAM